MQFFRKYYRRYRDHPFFPLGRREGVLRIILRWNGSVFRLLWLDLVIFIILYGILSVMYRVLLFHDPSHRHNFETIVKYVRGVAGLIPISFLLGFFVSSILNRWWTIINTVPWMPSIAFPVQAYLQPPTIKAKDMTPEIALIHKRMRDVRVSILRYMNMAWLLQLGSLSQQLRKRFGSPVGLPVCECVNYRYFCPTEKKPCKHHLDTVLESPDFYDDEDTCRQKTCIQSYIKRVNADPVVKRFFNPFITKEEMVIFKRREKGFVEANPGVPYKPEFLLPIMWASRVLSQARDSNPPLIRDDRHFDSMTQMLERFRFIMVQLGVYNDFNIPLSYTQVLVIAVYSFFLSELFAQQYIHDPNGSNFDIYVPLLSVLKFLYYIGWSKLGLSLVNPLSGHDAWEFPLSTMLNFNLNASSHCSAADDFLFPEYLGVLSGTANDMIDNMHGRTTLKFDKPPPEHQELMPDYPVKYEPEKTSLRDEIESLLSQRS